MRRSARSVYVSVLAYTFACLGGVISRKKLSPFSAAMNAKGQSLQGLADRTSGQVRNASIATDFCGATKHRNVPTTNSCTAARRSFFRLRFRGGNDRHFKPCQAKDEREDFCQSAHQFGARSVWKDPDKFCAARAKLVGTRTAAEQATAGINPPDRCQLAKGVCGAILFCAMMASARARFSSRRWLVRTRK